MLELINFLDVDEKIQMKTRDWRNSAHVTRFFQRQNIDEATHIKWLEQLKQKNPKTIAFFIRFHQQDIGVTYFHSIDDQEKKTDWGIYIYDEQYRGQGIGKQTLKWSLQYAKEHLIVKDIFLEVLENNVRAKMLYEKAGFKFVLQRDNVLRYKKEL